MDKVLHYARLYFLLSGKYIQARMQYRADFLISNFGILVGNAATVASVWVLFTSIPALGGYSYAQVVFLYAFAILAQTPMQIVFDNLWQLRMATNQGTFLKHYFRPLPTLFSYVTEVVDLKGFGMLAFAVGALIWSSSQLGIEWTPVRVLLLPVLLAGGGMIVVSLMILAASATFWIKDSFSILAFVSGVREHARYPLSIFNSFFQVVFTFIVPIAYIAWFPVQFYLSDTLPDWTAWASPLFAAALFWLAVQVWNAGTRRWAGTGS